MLNQPHLLALAATTTYCFDSSAIRLRSKDLKAPYPKVLKFELFCSRPYAKKTSRGWLREKMVRFELTIRLNGQRQMWSNMERKIENIVCIQKLSWFYH